jgi:carboxylesterase type B
MKGRVAGVIHQSAGWSATSSLTRDAGFKLGQALVEAHAGVEGRFEDLKAVPAEALIASQLSLFKRHYFSPVSDPETLPIPVEKLVQQGRMPPLNLLIGSNGNESLMYIPDNAVIDDYLQPAFPEAVWDEVRTALGSQSSELEQMDRL